jgi:hypothetical protein
METINDVRREEGNPDAGAPNTEPIAVNQTFQHPGAGVRLTATVAFVVGTLMTVIGIVTFIIPLAFIGVGVLLGGGFLLARARSTELPT